MNNYDRNRVNLAYECAYYMGWIPAHIDEYYYDLFWIHVDNKRQVVHNNSPLYVLDLEKEYSFSMFDPIDNWQHFGLFKDYVLDSPFGRTHKFEFTHKINPSESNVYTHAIIDLKDDYKLATFSSTDESFSFIMCFFKYLEEYGNS